MTAPPLAGLLGLLVADPGRPRITWYDGPERVELSGHVLDNWVTKTTHLLTDELDAGPGTELVVDLPWHWRTVVWCLAALRVGTTLVLRDPQDARADPGVPVVTDAPARHAGADELVVVALPALARTAGPDLPPGAIDAAAAVMTYPDQAGWLPPVPAGTVALRLAAGDVTHGDLATWADARTGPGLVPPHARVLATGTDAASLLALVLRVLADDGSVVMVAPGEADALRADGDRHGRLVAGERITLDLLG